MDADIFGAWSNYEYFDPRGVLVEAALEKSCYSRKPGGGDDKDGFSSP